MSLYSYLACALLLCLPQSASSFGTPAVGVSRSSSSAVGALSGIRPAVRQLRTPAAPAMMAKKVSKMIKLALDAGKANPAPPVGPALGAAGVNIMMFCKEYNARTQDKVGTVIPVEISVFEDRSFTFILKTPPAAELLKSAAKVKKGSGEPAIRNKAGDMVYNVVATVNMEQIKEIAAIKLPDLNTNKIESAMNTVIGTAKNMGSACRAHARTAVVLSLGPTESHTRPLPLTLCLRVCVCARSQGRRR